MSPLSTSLHTVDWKRIFPEGDHRWTMGLRPADAATFFAPRPDAKEALRLRERLLTDDPVRYAVLLPEAHGAVDETIDWLRTAAGRDVTAAQHAVEPYERLLLLGRSVATDFVWLQADDRRTQRVVGGVVCFPSSWDLGANLGAPLRRVHDPVPGLDEALGRQIDVFLAKLEPGAVWTRENWSLAADDERNHHPSTPRTPYPRALAADDVWIRLEHQLLVRLPRSQTVLFVIDVEPVPLPTLLRDTAATERLARLLETMSPAALRYKRLDAARDAIVRQLRGATSTVD